MPILSLALLGPVTVSLDDGPLARFPTERSRALLLYQATESALGHPVHRREALMALLWPDLPLKSARVSLRQTLYLLRQTVPDLPPAGGDKAQRFLLADRTTVRINPTFPLQLDIAAFLQLLERPVDDWPEAMALYRGDFLADFYLTDSANFEQWAQSRRAAFRRQALEALDRLTRHSLDTGQFGDAERYGHRQLAIDDLRESAYRQLMRLYAWSGRQAEALNLYETCVKTLDTELATAPDEATQALHEAIRENRLPPPLAAPGITVAPDRPAGRPPSPYRGLFAFRETDAPYFFGREAMTDRLLAAVRRQSLVAVVGPSGSGKTSVVYAGLVPALRDEGPWLVVSLRPGDRPFHALAGRLIGLLEPDRSETERLVETARLAAAFQAGDLDLPTVVDRLLDRQPAPAGAPPRLLLIVDQFEELFTLLPDVALRRHFLDVLLDPVARQPSRRHGRCLVLATLRADFLGQALRYRPLADALHEADVMLGPMTRDELERAIVEPADRQGVAFEPGLATRILDEVGHEPGNLPLLAFALEALWGRQTHDQMTHEGYETIGRVEGALARYADTVFAALEPDKKVLARRVFIQLIQPGAGTEDTRRQATRDELGAGSWPLVGRLADSRLLVTGRNAAGQETVELVHEALIQGWDRLQEWLEADRAFRLWQEQMRAALRDWLASDRDEGALLRGLALATAEAWLERRPDDLSEAERGYVAASSALRQRRRAVAARERMERERLRRTRTWILSGGLVLVALLGILAGLQWRRAERQRRALVEAQAALVQERDLARQALANQLVAEALNLTSQQPDLALLLAVEAVRRSGSQAARDNLATTMDRIPRLFARLPVPGRALSTVAISPDGQMLAVGDETGAIHLWRVALIPFALQPLTPLSAPSELPVRGLAFSPSGGTLAVAQQDHVLLFDLTAPPAGAPKPLMLQDSTTNDVRDVAFSPDGAWLALGSGAGQVQLWEVSGRRLARSLDIGSYIRAVAFTPDGDTVIAGSSDGPLVVWDLAGDEMRQVDTETAIFDLATSPDGAQVALVGPPSRVELWQLDRLERVATAAGVQANILDSVVFHPDGRLVSAGHDGHLVLWQVAGRELVPEALAAHQGIVRAVAMDPGGRWLAASGQSGFVTLWSADVAPTDGLRLVGHAGGVEKLAFADDQLLVSLGCENWTMFAQLTPPSRPCTWIETGRWPLTGTPGPGAVRWLSELPATVTGLDLSPDGRTAVLGFRDGSVVLWDVSQSRERGVLEPPQDQPSVSFAFARQGALLANGRCEQAAPAGFCQKSQISLWEIEPRPQRQRDLTELNGLPTWLALSPGGQWLAYGAVEVVPADVNLNLWLWHSSQEEPRRGPPDIQEEVDVLQGTFHPENGWLATSSNVGQVYLWQLPELELRSRFDSGGAMTAMAFSPDGRYLALGGCDSILQAGGLVLFVLSCAPRLVVLDLETGRLLPRVFDGHRQAVLSLAFSQDGATLAAGDVGGDILLWDLSVTLEAEACRRAGRNLNSVEWARYFGAEPYRPTCPELAGAGP